MVFQTPPQHPAWDFSDLIDKLTKELADIDAKTAGYRAWLDKANEATAALREQHKDALEAAGLKVRQAQHREAEANKAHMLAIAEAKIACGAYLFLEADRANYEWNHFAPSQSNPEFVKAFYAAVGLRDDEGYPESKGNQQPHIFNPIGNFVYAVAERAVAADPKVKAADEARLLANADTSAAYDARRAIENLINAPGNEKLDDDTEKDHAAASKLIETDRQTIQYKLERYRTAQAAGLKLKRDIALKVDAAAHALVEGDRPFSFVVKKKGAN